ncbi:MAG: prepilin-type N-terminal cleavage/methylation domain-containing protein, partial [Candidatus Paceibacteria bacterium]
MKYRKKGFTLIEMLVVIGIALTLLVIMLVNLNDSRKKARDNVRVADISTIRLALEEYRVACGVFPTRLDITANNG